MDIKEMRIDARSAAAGGAAGLVVGLCAGYFAQRRVFQARLDKELLAVKEYYNGRFEELENLAMATRLSAVASFPAGDEDDGEAAVGHHPAESPAEPGPGASRVAPAQIDGAIMQAAAERLGLQQPPAPEDVDLDVIEAELKEKVKTKPYQISEEEFLEGVDGYQQLAITYYAGDKVLVDDKEQPIPDILRTVGMLDRDMFGKETVRYVRNDKLEIDFEVILSNRSYVDAILHYGRPGRRDDAAERPARDEESSS